jgi:hypothetical protein
LDPKFAALVDRRVLAVSLRALAASNGGAVFGTGAELHQALAATLPACGAADPAMPTCGGHLDHLLRELGSYREPMAGLQVTRLAYTGGWHLLALPLAAAASAAPAAAAAPATHETH